MDRRELRIQIAANLLSITLSLGGNKMKPVRGKTFEEELIEKDKDFFLYVMQVLDDE